MSRSKTKVIRDKKNKKPAETSPLTMHSRACAVAIGRTQEAATVDTIAWPPGGDGLRRRENERMLSRCFVNNIGRYANAMIKVRSIGIWRQYSATISALLDSD